MKDLTQDAFSHSENQMIVQAANEETLRAMNSWTDTFTLSWETNLSLISKPEGSCQAKN